MEEDTKSVRKRKRFAARIKSSKGIDCTVAPSVNIVLCNVGQATSFEKDNLEQLIKRNELDIQCPKFIAEKGESHSFLVFKNIEQAVMFYEAFNGKVKADENGTLLYMSYIQNVPNTDVICCHPDPAGLTLLNNFITFEEEIMFLELFNWTSDASSLKNRQVRHYGYEFRYGTNDVDLDNPLSEKIPERCDILWQRLEEQGFELGVPDQLTVNKYSPGQGIPSHVDRHSPFGSTILSLSLGSAVVMDWKHHTRISVPVHVQPRSLLIMQDEARYDWQHGIQSRTFDPIIEYRQADDGQRTKVITSDTVPRQTRVSLTFRWTRRGPCHCQYKTLCDDVTEQTNDDLDDNVASKLEDLHVHQVYNRIASHFSRTRHSPWPAAARFCERARAGHVLVDLGAGNGKNILRRDDLLQIAGERSSALLAECAGHTRALPGADWLCLDLLHCPLRDCVADLVLCVAVVHHFSTTARRVQAISTIHRVLRPGGVALITVWAKDQSRSNYLLKSKIDRPSDDIRLNVAGVNLHVHENRTQFKHKDLLVPWKLKTNNQNKEQDTLLRYYHVFEEGELDAICTEVGLEVERSFYEEGNWCVECKKV